MAVEVISPRMRAALEADARPRFFGDVWLDVLHDHIDNQEHFQASHSAVNMDFDFIPGQARLAIDAAAYNISQLNQNASADVTPAIGSSFSLVYQKFRIDFGRSLSGITVYLAAGIVPTVARVQIVKQQFDYVDGTVGFYPVLFSTTWSLAAGFSGTKSVTLPIPVDLPEGDYYLLFSLSSTSILYSVKYQNTDSYAGGQLDRVTFTLSGGMWIPSWQRNLGDAYFDLELSGFKASGSMKGKILDVGAAPDVAGTFQFTSEVPVGTVLNASLEASTSPDMSSPVTFENAADGLELPVGYRYWQPTFYLYTDATARFSPMIDMCEVLFPRQHLLLRPADEDVGLCDSNILGNYEPLLVDAEFQPSAIDTITHVASGGELSMQLQDPTGERIRWLISNFPLKNFRAILYMGANVPGFSAGDLVRVFVGTVQTVDYVPGYRGEPARLRLATRNPILELKQKIPRPVNTGLIDFDAISINYDALHVMDAMVDIIRGKADLPARYVNLSSFLAARTTIGDATLPAPAYVVRRSNAAGLPDTRIKKPEEALKFLQAMAVIADGYIAIDGNSRLFFVKYDTTAGHEAIWADEDLVKAGYDGIPIETVAKLDMGYDSRLFNAVIMGCEWDGDGDDWSKNFGKVYGNVDADSADYWAPGKNVFVSVMEKNLIEASKFLGPEDGYNGESIAQTLTARLVARYAYPPVIMRGVVVRMGEFMRELGSVVKVYSRRFAKAGRNGIAESESKKFMVISKQHDKGANRMVFDLMELT